MKKILCYLFAFASFAFFACNKIEQVSSVNEYNDSVQEYSFTATLPSETRVSVNDALNAFWVKNDAISVLMTSNRYNKFTLRASSAGSNQGVFTGTSQSQYKPKDGGLVIYPYENFSNNSNKLYTFQSSITYALDGEKAVSTVPAVGIVSYKNNELRASLKHVAGAIMVTYYNVPLNAKYMVLTTGENEYITGTATIDENNPFSPLTISGSSNGNGNTVTFTFDQEYREKMPFIIPVPAGIYNYISFVLLDRNGNEISATRKTSTKKYTIEAGHVLPFKITPKYDLYTFEELEKGESINLSEADKYIYVYQESFDSTTGKGVGKFSGDDNKREAVDCDIFLQDNGNGPKKTVVMDYADYITSYHFYSASQITINGQQYTMYNVQTSKLDAYGEPYVWHVIVDNTGDYVIIRTVEQNYWGNWEISATLRYIPYNQLTAAEKREERNKNGVFKYGDYQSNIHIYKLVPKN